MNATRKNLLVGAAVVVGFVAALAGSFNYLEDQQSAANGAVGEAAACRLLAGQITVLRGAGTSSSTAPAQHQVDLTQRIAQAATHAGLPDHNLGRIESDPARRSTAGPYLEKPTRLVLHGATLRQVITLLHDLDRPGEGLSVEKLHLSAAEDIADSRAWSAEALVVYTVPDEKNGGGAMH